MLDAVVRHEQITDVLAHPVSHAVVWVAMELQSHFCTSKFFFSGINHYSMSVKTISDIYDEKNTYPAHDSFYRQKKKTFKERSILSWATKALKRSFTRLYYVFFQNSSRRQCQEKQQMLPFLPIHVFSKPIVFRKLQSCSTEISAEKHWQNWYQLHLVQF